MCFGISSVGQLFHTNMATTKKDDYKSVSILLKFAFNISIKVRENIFEPKNAQRRACLEQIIVKAQMTPGSERTTYAKRKCIQEILNDLMWNIA